MGCSPTFTVQDSVFNFDSFPMDVNISVGNSSRYKRKRDVYDDDSDDEVPAYGKQILPVACLPHNFDGEPQDGLEYLFTVRRDAMRLPEITRVPNPFQSTPLPPIVKTRGPRHPSLPSEEWCTLLETRFKNFRDNFNQPTIFVGQAHEPNRKYIPDRKERDLWWAYLEGKPESEWNIPKKPKKQNKRQPYQRKDLGMRAWADEPEQEQVHRPETIIHESSLLNDEGEVEQALSIDPAEGLPTPTGTPGPLDSSPIEGPSTSSQDKGKCPALQPREPSTTTLKLIDEPTAIHLLMYFTHWINCHIQNTGSFPPRESHARWIFALLSRIDEYISADDMNLLRNLARACLALLDTLLERRMSPRIITAASSDSNNDSMSERSCWIILSIVVHVWKQRDLWMDAENVLEKYPTTSCS